MTTTTSTEKYRELCSRMLVPDSERLVKIWMILCDEDDARLLLAMPGTSAAIAATTGMPMDEVERRLQSLFFKGVAFPAEKPQGTTWRPPRHLIQMHDASVQWPDAPREFFDVWKTFMDEEMPALLALLLSSGIPSFMRVIPAAESLKGMADVLPQENVEQVIQAARELAIVRCPCRLAMRGCNAKIETCIQIDKGAAYNLKRGTGRSITKDEALAIVRESEAAGLVHTLENRAGIGNVLCNCCNDCCAIIGPYRKGPQYRPILAPSRFEPIVDAPGCIGDKLCIDICPVEAVTYNDDLEAPDINTELCIGCGLCVSACTTGALSLKIARPPEFIPA